MKPTGSNQQEPHRIARRKRGFERTSGLLQGQIRKAGETRGFAVSRLLTHWAEVVGEDTAKIARPVDVKYGRKAFGATLTVLTTGANAPMLEMQKDQIKTRVNQVYGYAAISNIRITQTAATGFAEGQVAFVHKQKTGPKPPEPAKIAAAKQVAAPVKNDELRHALERLGASVLSRKEGQK